MTRKDLEAVAELLGKIDAGAVDAKRFEITGVLRTTNANFNGERFWKAVEDWR